MTESHKKGTLDLADLYDVPAHLESTKLTDKLEANWFDEIKLYPENPSLIRATLRTMGWKLLLMGLVLIPIVSLVMSFNFSNISTIVIVRYHTTLSTHPSDELL